MKIFQMSLETICEKEVMLQFNSFYVINNRSQHRYIRRETVTGHSIPTHVTHYPQFAKLYCIYIYI